MCIIFDTTGSKDWRPVPTSPTWQRRDTVRQPTLLLEVDLLTPHGPGECGRGKPLGSAGQRHCGIHKHHSVL